MGREDKRTQGQKRRGKEKRNMGEFQPPRKSNVDIRYLFCFRIINVLKRGLANMVAMYPRDTRWTVLGLMA